MYVHTIDWNKINKIEKKKLEWRATLSVIIYENFGFSTKLQRGFFALLVDEQ